MAAAGLLMADDEVSDRGQDVEPETTHVRIPTDLAKKLSALHDLTKVSTSDYIAKHIRRHVEADYEEHRAAIESMQRIRAEAKKPKGGKSPGK